MELLRYCFIICIIVRAGTGSFVQLLERCFNFKPGTLQSAVHGPSWFMFVLFCCPSVQASHYLLSHWVCIKQSWVFSLVYQSRQQQFRLAKLKKWQKSAKELQSQTNVPLCCHLPNITSHLPKLLYMIDFMVYLIYFSFNAGTAPYAHLLGC